MNLMPEDVKNINHAEEALICCLSKVCMQYGQNASMDHWFLDSDIPNSVSSLLRRFLVSLRVSMRVCLHARFILRSWARDFGIQWHRRP
jgi:hypothetical protein